MLGSERNTEHLDVEDSSHTCPRDDFIQSGIESATTEKEPEVDITRGDLATPWETELELISHPPVESHPVPATTEPAHQLFEDNTREVVGCEHLYRHWSRWSA